MRFLAVGDPHTWDRNILTRKDSSSKTGLNKLQAISEIAEQQKVDCVIFTGDFFHAPIRSKAWLFELKTILRSFKVPLFSIFGNHDIPDGSFENRFYTDMGNLFLDGYMRCLLPAPTFFKEIGISGISCYTPQENYQPDERTQILVIHHFLAPAFNDKNILPPEQIKALYPNIKIVIAGHDHMHYPADESNGFLLIRPGSMIRPSASSENNRIPEIALIDTDIISGTDISSLHWISLPADPFESLFDIQSRSNQKAKAFSLDEFTSSVKSVKSITTSVEEAFKTKLSGVSDAETHQFIKSDLLARGLISEV